MKSYVWLTFAFLGWGYYEMSGGADFAPEQTAVAIAEVEVETPDIVTRASSPTLLAVSASNVVAEPVAEPVVVPVAAPVAEPVVVPEPVPEVVAAVEPVIDVREVAGTRVNMRMGPGTTFDVITTLDGGTKLEVLSVNESGWANVSTEFGVEGWMAERLLTDS